MLKKKDYYHPEYALHTSTELTEGAREKKIEELEKRRLDVVREIESLLCDFARESGDGRIGKRQHKVGKAPNDYTKKKR